MTDRLLVITYAFPPIAVPEAVLVAKALHALDGFEIDVICATPMAWHGKDPTLSAYAEEPVQRVVRVPVPWWLPVVQPVRAMRRYPDAMRFLRRRTRRAVEALGPDRYAAMLTWSQWHSVHLVGLDVVARHPHLPWMAHFSDPWVDNPLVHLDPVARRVAVRMERAVLERTDAAVFTAEPARRLTLGRYPEDWSDRFHVVPHLFDETLYDGAGASTAEDDGALVVRHLGTFYGDRRPDPLLRALEWVQEHAPQQLAGVRVELVGSMPSEMRRALGTARLPAGLVEDVGRVDYGASLRLMRAADVLVAIDAPSPQSVFLASKVVDYLGAGQPIVGLVPPGAAAEAVEAAGGWTADPVDVEAGGRALLAALERARHPLSPTEAEAAARARFSAANVGSQRTDILRRIVHRTDRPALLRQSLEPGEGGA